MRIFNSICISLFLIGCSGKRPIPSSMKPQSIDASVCIFGGTSQYMTNSFSLPEKEFTDWATSEFGGFSEDSNPQKIRIYGTDGESSIIEVGTKENELLIAGKSLDDTCRLLVFYVRKEQTVYVLMTID